MAGKTAKGKCTGAIPPCLPAAKNRNCTPATSKRDARVNEPTCQPRSVGGTILGLLSILCWSLSIAFARRVTEDFGIFDGLAISFFAGGTLGCVWLASTGRLRRALAMPRAYHLVCGGLMVGYCLCYSMAIGLACDRQTVLEVGIINYLWPGLTMLLAVPILGRRAKPLLLPGILLAFAGAALSLGQGSGFSWDAFGRHLLSCSRAHLLALAAALLWGLYSNFNARLSVGTDGVAAPLHLMAAGMGLFVMRIATGGSTTWHPDDVSWIYLAATAIFPVLLGYMFWEAAMRRGHLNIVVPASYGTPLLSTVVSVFVLGVQPGPGLWIACMLVIAGALICKSALREPVA